VSGHEDHAAAAPQTFEVILESVMNDESRDVAFVQFPEVGKFHEQPSEISEASSENPFPMVIAQFRKRHLQIPQTGAPLPDCEMESKPRQDLGGWVCKGARHLAEYPGEEQCEGVFGDSFNAFAHRGIFAYFA
jgi:hypothetical protein